MDQPVISTEAPKYLTREFLEATLVQNKARIDQLEEHVQRVTQRDYSTRAELVAMRDNMHTWTLEALDNANITESEAEEIAEICNFELTKEFEVEVTVMYSVTVNARNEEEVQNVIHEIDFDSVSYNSDYISYLSSSIDNIEV